MYGVKRCLKWHLFYLGGEGMKEKVPENQDNSAPRSAKGWIALCIPCAFVFAGVIVTGIFNYKIEKSKEIHDIEMKEFEKAYEQHFYNNSNIVEKTGIEYIQYEIKADPAVAGYHVIPCPYLVYEIGGIEHYIPLIGQFTQEEYVARENGCCDLFRENTSKELQEIVESIVGDSVEIKCLIAIQYVKEDQEKREIYDVRDGQLTKTAQEVAIEVLKLWENEDSKKIDMWGWPRIDWVEVNKVF